jgi:processive 1,2-diacylglycerol beta-glucosyltransferase
MSISDLVVTKPGGLTSTESLASGLPIIAINPIPGQEVENAEFLEDAGVAIWLKKHDNFDEKIANILSDENELYHMKVKTKLLAKKNSTANICKIIMKKY